MPKFLQSPPSQGIVLGLFFQILGRFLDTHTWRGYQNHVGKVGQWCVVLGGIMVLIGCLNYVRLKRLNPWLGLFGVLSLPGFLVLWAIHSLRIRKSAAP
jgi:hypothetical protein